MSRKFQLYGSPIPVHSIQWVSSEYNLVGYNPKFQRKQSCISNVKYFLVLGVPQAHNTLHPYLQGLFSHYQRDVVHRWCSLDSTLQGNSRSSSTILPKPEERLAISLMTTNNLVRMLLLLQASLVRW